VVSPLLANVYLTSLFQRFPVAKTVDDYNALLPWKMVEIVPIAGVSMKVALTPPATGA
jgi:hypothetical protein